MKTTALASWFGSNRMLAENVGKELAGCSWVGVPFAGGMCEVAHIKARSLLVNDKHRHVINLAMVVADPDSNARMREYLDNLPFHPEVLEEAQEHCRVRDGMPYEYLPNFAWACDYFVCSWMARNATAGTKREFDAGMSIRWNANGGGSNVRYRSAIESLADWHEVMKRCEFTCMDAFDFLTRVGDEIGHGLYLDPPFFDAGRKYKHDAGQTEAEQIAWQTRLRDAVARFDKCRVVMRFYDVPLVRELYPESRWTWRELEGRKQSNAVAPEVLIVSGAKATMF